VYSLIKLLVQNTIMLNCLFRNQTTWLPYIIFGVLGIIQVITVFWIPETLGVPMLTTLEEAEEFYKNVNSKDAVDMKHEDEKTNVSVSDL
jgi:hypothetical protein